MIPSCWPRIHKPIYNTAEEALMWMDRYHTSRWSSYWEDQVHLRLY